MVYWQRAGNRWQEYLFLFSTASCLRDAFFFLILWPGINVDSHVVLTVFHFVTVNVVKRKVLFHLTYYTWRGEGRIENRSFPGSRISACDRFRIPNFLIFSICFSSFHLFIISAVYYNHSYLFTLKTSDRKL